MKSVHLSVWIVFSTALALSGIAGEVTNEVDLAALAACGTGTTNGWTVTGIDSYSDGKTNIRLNAGADYVLSEVFSAPIIRFAVKIKSSAQAARKLAFIPLIDGAYADEAAIRWDYSPNNDTYVSQTATWPTNATVTAFKIGFDNGGGSTGWGISQLLVITEDASLPETPQNLRFLNNRLTSQGRLEWDEAANATEYELAVDRLDQTAASSGTLVCRCDVAFFENSRSSTKDMTSAFLASNLWFGANAVYAPTNTRAIAQLGNSSERGALICNAVTERRDDYYLRFRAMRYTTPSGKHDSDYCSFGWLPDPYTTNVFASITLGDEFQWHGIPVGPVQTITDGQSPAGLLVNADGNKTEHRVLFTDFELYDGYSAGVTNVTRIAAATVAGNAICCREHGIELETGKTYIFRVRSRNANGQTSEYSAANTNAVEAASGFTLFVR